MLVGETKEESDVELEELEEDEVDKDVLVEVEEVEDEVDVEDCWLTVDCEVTEGMAADDERGQWSEMKCI